MNTVNRPQPLVLPSSNWPAGWAGRWLAAVLDWRRQRRADHAKATGLHASLLELDARTLCDIGAPPALQARAMRHRQAQRDRLDEQRAGGAAGDWGHW